MKAFSKTLLLLAGMSLLLAGCQKEGRNGGDADLIRFSASARPETKTAYGDYENDNNGDPVWQRIEWQVDDLVRIFSPEATDRYNDSKHYADYRVVEVSNSGRISEAKIVNSADDNDNDNGLLWGDADSYTFYGIYPMLTGSVATTDNVNSCSFTGAKIDANQGTGDLSVNMPKYGYLTAVKAGVSSRSNVRLEFEPAEVTLKAREDVVGEITLVDFNLVSLGDDVLGGPFSINYSGTDRSFDFSSATDKTVGVTFPAGTTISATKGLTFTVYALPQTVSNLMLDFTVKDANNQNVHRRLKLTKSGSAIEFTGCRKHRIYGVAMPDGIWQLEIDGDVLPWNGYSETIDSQVSVEGKVQITGDIESVYMDVDSDYKNHYKSAFGYSKFYQIRTLDRGTTPIRPGEEETPRVPLGHFEMTFRPTAPVGGYWQLIPQFKDGDTESPKHFRFEVVLPGGVISDQLTGPIINEAITVKIYPKDYESSDMNVYEVWFTAYFSPSKSFNPLISADSEFQDVHGDGRFSYWTFRLTQDQNKIAQE